MTSSVSAEPRLSVVIAVFNEENNLAALIHEIDAVCDARRWVREIIVVDDGSTDNSARVAGSMANVTVFRFRRKVGQTAAFDAGCQRRSTDTSSPWTATGRTPPPTFPT
jgi:glycosyltransferase involved in cell wall biosynthesis